MTRLVFCCRNTDSQPWIEGLQRVMPQVQVQVWEPGGPATADYAVVWAPPQQFIDEQPQLRALFNIGAGVDALLQLQLPPQLPIIRLEDAGMGVQMAEYACHVLMRHFRSLDAMQAQQAKGLWQAPPAPVRSEFPIGLMGLGVLGHTLARALRLFEFPVNAWTRTPPAELPSGVRSFVGEAGLEPFLRASRGLVCLLPLTPQTENILNRRTLGLLRKGAYVVNVARGAHVVDEDLLALIDEGHVAGATLDVFRQEPLPPEHPFWRHPRICVTPHTSARTLRQDSIAQIAGKIAAVAAGSPLQSVGGLVIRERGY